MEIKAKHRKIIGIELKKYNGAYNLVRIKKFPKKIKFHVHLSDGFSGSTFFYKIEFQSNDKSMPKLYCKLSPTILVFYFNITFWTEGEKWMNSYKLSTIN